MSHEAATREALTRYLAEAPSGDVIADRLARTARGTLAMYDQAAATPGADTSWADHNLAIIIAGGLQEPTLKEAATGLFRGTRRRLADALAADPDDLAPALALALGAATSVDDARMATDVACVADAVARPQAGPRLVRAAVAMMVRANGAKDEGVKAAALAAVPALQAAADGLAARLPNHPDVVLDRARLALHRSHAEDGEARQAAMDVAHGLLADHEAKFGPTREARSIRGELLAWRARTGGAGSDIRTDAVALFEAQAADGTLGPAQARRLVDAIDRGKALNAETARGMAATLDAIAGDDPGPWRKVMTRLLKHTGEDTSLLRLWERSLLEDPGDEEAATGLGERLLRNLRAGVASPFESQVLERVMAALPHRAMARWRPDDVGRVVDHATEVFGVATAAAFVRDRILGTHELRKKEGTWTLALSLFERLGDQDALLDIARRAAGQSKSAKARLLVAEHLIAGEPSLSELEEAGEVLRPLLSTRGPAAATAHKLHQRVLAHPGFRHARMHALEAFEERIGVGTDTAFKLRVIHTTPTYVLVEAHEHKAPEVYEHRFLRTLIRAQDLPKGVHPMHLRKGDQL
ncbi:MAG: hypothetical protein QF464_11600, partial [Myxococcota bacterium]|nr:hypothetical protein [Myxococcota bacterium]